jgi:SSS family solute:Na+ symporter
VFLKKFIEVEKMNFYLATIICYAIVLVGLGYFIGKHVKGAADFFVGNRDFGWPLLFTTLIAANIGAGSTVGVTGLAFKFGVSSWWWIGCSGLGSLLLAYVVGPKVWKIAKERNLFTMGDYLDYRYAPAFRAVTSTMMAVGTLALFSGQLIGIAWILNVVAGIDKLYGIIIGAVVVTVYFSAGGLRSAAVVNILELAVILIGFIVATPYALSYVGGWGNLQVTIAHNLGDAAKTAKYFAWDGMGYSTIIGYFLMLTPAFCISPGLIGKVYSAKNTKAVKVGTLLNGIVQLVFAFLPLLIGMCAFAAFPDLKNQELALPTAMKEMMPFGIAALALSAIFAAEVSTADTVLYMLATSLSKDLYKTFFRPQASDAELLSFSRKVTVVCGLVGIFVAHFMANIITALSIFYSLMTVSLAAPFLFGLFSKKASTKGAFVSAGIGVALTLALQFGNGGKGLWILNATSTGILAAAIMMFISLFVFPRKEKAQ